MKKIKYNCNTCDRIYNEVIIHFTKACDNRCPFCIDKSNAGVGCNAPDVAAICHTLMAVGKYIDAVTISGGEPFLFMEDLKKLVDFIKAELPDLKITVMSAVPKVCADRRADFEYILSKIDYLGVTPQHWDESVADAIRGHASGYDRQKFYSELKFKEKVGININCCTPYLCEKDDILKAVAHYNGMGFRNIRICEMFEKDDMYVDVCKVLGIKLDSPFASGCKTKYDIRGLIPGYEGDFYIKRSCFYRTKCQKASIWDFIKVVTRHFFARHKYFFGVVHENGVLSPYWI